MCMNCGCGQPHEDHGVEANITAADLKRAGEANDQTLRESAQHIIEAVALLDEGRTGDRGLGQPAGPAGAATDGDARGTPATES
ncbi:MAG TPA: hypothetical protein VMQ65_07090 [Candidatus Limnocylindria bacterium]|nr:hypothetical protein [Candidatus Limnocylindria bacterium]